MFRRTRLFLTNTPGFRWVMPFLFRSGIYHIYCVTIKEKIVRSQNVEEREKFANFCEEHAGEFERLRGMLADDFSQETLDKVIEYRKHWRYRDLKGVICHPQYFQSDVFGPVANEVFVDGGAYNGDTIIDLTKHFGKGVNYCKKIYAWEPDSDNIRLLKKKLGKYNNLCLVQKGMWKENAELMFSSGGGVSSKIDSDGDLKIPVDSIDNVCADETVTFIKMDIEGSEQMALRGAEKVIRRDKPRLAICIYHSWNDLFDIAFMIKEMVPEYRLFIRHHSESSAETVLYATL